MIQAKYWDVFKASRLVAQGRIDRDYYTETILDKALLG